MKKTFWHIPQKVRTEMPFSDSIEYKRGDFCMAEIKTFGWGTVVVTPLCDLDEEKFPEKDFTGDMADLEAIAYCFEMEKAVKAGG